MRDRKEKFSKIYRENLFKGKESKSGPGSNLEQTAEIRKALQLSFINADFQSILDAPCGDCHWIQDIWHHIPMYVGADIVPEMIFKNRKKYPKKEFRILDITSDPLPKTDLMLCRDCLVHMSFDEIIAFFNNFIASEIPFLLTTSFMNNTRKNVSFDLEVNWFPLNLMVEPFNFTQPLIVINEKCTECNGDFSDKSLVLYSRSQIKDAVANYKK